MTRPEPRADAPIASIIVVSGDPTPEELAAVTAVLGALIEEQSVDVANPPSSAPSATWSTPILRSPVYPGLGAWLGAAR